jgi:hypothetical protein
LDFSIQVSTSAVGAVVGTTTTPVTVSVTALNGFSGSVSVALMGLPPNVTSSQTFPLSIAANSSAQVTFTAAPAASIGSYSLVFSGASGTLSHSAPLTLNLTTSLMAAIDVPQSNASVTGSVMVSGWAFEALPVSLLQVLVDNAIQGQAVYGFPRPDVHMGIPSAPVNSGYYFRLDTTTLTNGSHSLSLRITDTSSNVSNFGAVPFNVSNPVPLPPGPVASLSITAPTTSLTVGNIVSFTPVATDAGGNPVAPAFTWQSSAPSVAKVAPNGVVLALAAGSANITVSGGGKTSAAVGVSVAAASGTPGTIQVTLGAEEVVFQYKRDACIPGDNPDNPARFVRLGDGSLLLSASQPLYWFESFGADFYSLKRSCTPAMPSPNSPDPSTFKNRQWIFSTYYDGSAIHALVHNEFHDPVNSLCLAGTTPPNPSSCVYVSIEYGTSSDGGHTFSQNPSPLHLVAPAPVQWTPPASGAPAATYAYGYWAPTNIVHSPDGFYYAMFIAIDPSNSPQRQGICTMRTANLADPTSWRAWDGTAFALQMTDPYTGPPPAVCQRNYSINLNDSLTFNTYLNKFMLVGISEFQGQCGVFFSLSSDMINWTVSQFVVHKYVPMPTTCSLSPGGLAGDAAYGAIVDHDDTTPNFERPGRTPYLYYSRFNDNGADRDLVRVPLIFTQF